MEVPLYIYKHSVSFMDKAAAPKIKQQSRLHCNPLQCNGFEVGNSEVQRNRMRRLNIVHCYHGIATCIIIL